MDSLSNTGLPADPLASWLTTKEQEWVAARSGQSAKLEAAYDDFMRIPRDDDTKGTGAARAKNTAALFVGSTRNKVRSARAKIKDVLFGAGDRVPFDTEPVNESLAPLADAVEKIIAQQLEDGGFNKALRTGIGPLANYGTAFIAGPFVRTASKREVDLDEEGRIAEVSFEYPEPYFELARTLDVYMAPDAEGARVGDGVIWVSKLNKATVAKWKGRPNFKNIDAALKGAERVQTVEGSDRAQQHRGSVQTTGTDKRIKVVRYFGLVPSNMLNDSDDADEASENAGKMEEAIVIMAGGVIVFAAESAYEERPLHRCVYEEVEHEPWGVGIAENNAANQKLINAAFRLVANGKGMAMQWPKSVDKSKFQTGEDFKLYPGKTFKFKSGLTPQERENAIMFHQIPDVTGGWDAIIDRAERFSDDDTGVTKYDQGTDAKHLNQTATGISLIMNAASLPQKEVMQNIDQMWIESCIEALLTWNLEFLEVGVVRKLHGDDIAEKWAIVKEFGKTSFMEWSAIGAKTFVAHEVLMQKLQGFLALASSSPVLAELVDFRELLEQIWDANEVGGEGVVYSEETLAERRNKPNPAAALELVPQDSPVYPAVLGAVLAQLGIADENVATALGTWQSKVQAEVAKAGAEADEAKADAVVATAEAGAATVAAGALGV